MLCCVKRTKLFFAPTYLKGLGNLQHLDLSGTQVTPEGVKKLQESLPDCEIEY